MDKTEKNRKENKGEKKERQFKNKFGDLKLML